MSPAPIRAHLITGGFPPGRPAGHDHDFARLRLLEMLQEWPDVMTTTAGDFTDVAKWLPETRLLITYVAGPFADEPQADFIQEWLDAGGRWLGLHGTAGGKAARPVQQGGRRAMVKSAHHHTLGAFFLNHPPMRRFQVNAVDASHPLLRGVPDTFEVVDEPYMVEVLDPDASQLLLTAQLGPDNSPPGFGFDYESDTALLPDGKTRAIGYTKEVGRGGVAYFTLGHCHSPLSNTQPFVDASVDPSGTTPLQLRGPWETPAFQRLVRNAIAWGLQV